MKMALRAMGKRSLKELSKKELVSYDELTAKMIGIPFSFEDWEDRQTEKIFNPHQNPISKQRKTRKIKLNTKNT